MKSIAMDSARVYLKRIGRMARPKNIEKLVEVADELASATSPRILLFSGLDVLELNYLFGAFLLKTGMKPYVKLNFYDLISIFFQRAEEFASAEALKGKTVLLWGGFHETHNKMTPDLVLDTVDKSLSNGDNIFVAIQKGRYIELDQSLRDYPRAHLIEEDFSFSTPNGGKRVERF